MDALKWNKYAKVSTWGPFTTVTWINFNPNMDTGTVSNYIHNNKVWDKITYPFPNFNSCIIELSLGNWYLISSHTLPGMWSLIHVGIEVNPC